MTVASSREIVRLSSIGSWPAPTWREVVRQPRVRWQLLAITILSVILIGVLLFCLTPFAAQRTSDRLPTLTDLLGTVRVPDDLPGSPTAAQSMLEEPPSLLGEDAIAQNARAPFVALGSPARPFHFVGSVSERMNARACLAAAMVYEAGDDGIGQLAVGQVILNRARHPAFPASVCGVVTQGSDRATGCQFTFTCDGSLARSISLPVRARALVHADLMLDGLVFAGVGLATHYHTNGVYPWWSPKLDKIARVGTHLFFRWPGIWGSSRVFAGDRRAGESSAALFGQFGSTPLAITDVTPLVEAPVEAGLRSDALDAMAKAAGPVAAVAQPDSNNTGLSRAAAIPEARRLASIEVPLADRQDVIQSGPALPGMRLLKMFPDQGVFYLQLTAGSSPAARKRAADQLCGGRAICKVYAWWSADAVPRTAQLDATSRAALAFTYVRHVDPNAQSRSASQIIM